MSSRASRLTLALTVVGVAGAITIVHNMQTEERKRLHQVRVSISPLSFSISVSPGRGIAANTATATPCARTLRGRSPRFARSLAHKLALLLPFAHQGVIRDKAVLAEKEEERRNAGTTR